MARQTAWVLALVLTCAPALGASSQERNRQGRPEPPQQGPGKDAKSQPVAITSKPPDSTSKPPDDRWKWWLYDRAELGITDKQSTEINQVWESTIPKLREARHEQDRAEDELSRTIKEHKADVATISMLVDRVESARSQHSKMRVIMLYRIDLLLSAEQRVKVEALRARRDAERRDKEPPSGHRDKPRLDPDSQ
jgi:Spy/CpxP family protein refolding chaperone